MSEARIVLAHPLGAGATAELDIAYSISVFYESRRLRDIGAPVDVALKTDWDRISASFTAVRGAGYVAWYPVALEPESMKNGNAVFREIERWKARAAQSAFEMTTHDGGRGSTKPYPRLGMTVPVLTSVVPPVVTKNGVALFADSQAAAEAVQFSTGAEQFAQTWLPARSTTAKVWVLPEEGDVPFVSGSEAFVPPNITEQAANGITLHALSNMTLASTRQWIQEGYASFLELAYTHQERGRTAVLQMLSDRTQALAINEPDNTDTADTSLINSAEESRYRLKASLAWWMLRDIVGDAALQRAIKNYKSADDRSTDYMQKLVEAESHKDLGWFFSDWVYRDRGLPEFAISNAASRKTLEGKWVTEVKIANSGGAGAVVPVMVSAGDDQEVARVQVPARGSAIISIATSFKPTHARVNDGSVPETDPNDNEADIK